MFIVRGKFMRVALCFGGRSVEHDISVITALQVLKTMLKMYEVIACYVDHDGNMFAKTIKEVCDKNSLLQSLKPVEMNKKNYEYYFQVINKIRQRIYFDFVLPLFHGTYGEDGSFQGLLRFLNIPYGFSDMLSLACMQDKEMMKHLLQEANIPTIRWFVLHEKTILDQKIYEKCNRLGYPLILKAAHLGSSIGIEVVDHQEQLQDKLQAIFKYDDKVIVERFIEHKVEYHMAIFKDDYSQIEAIQENEIYSFEKKYQNKEIKKSLPAKLNNQQIIKMQQYAKLCKEIFQIDSMVRIDFIEDQQGCLYVNEINGIAGSFAYQLWEASGKDLSQMIEMVIIEGLNRYRKYQSKIYKYQSDIEYDGHKIK